MNIHIIHHFEIDRLSAWEDFNTVETPIIDTRSGDATFKNVIKWIESIDLRELPYEDIYYKSFGHSTTEYILSEKESAMFLMSFT